MANANVTSMDLIIVDSKPHDYDAMLAGASAGFTRTRFVESGELAIRLPRVAPLNLWLINTRLPDMPGAELLALLRGVDCMAIYLLVGDEYGPADELAARRAGATMYVCKPPRADWLRACTSRWPPFRAARSADTTQEVRHAQLRLE